MSSLNKSIAQSPTSKEVEATILNLQSRFPRLLTVRTPGRSAQGRPIYAVTVTDSQISDQNKQHVLILASQHGEEESTRLIALAVLQWLCGDSAAEIRRDQKIVILPNANPDGADADRRANSQGVNLNTDHPPSGAVTPEGQAIEQVARELAPEAVIDLHSRGTAGCSYDMVMYPATKPYTEDGRIVVNLAEEMAAAGEAAGIPHVVHPLTWPGWWDEASIDLSSRTLVFMYRNFKSICLLTETAESNEFAPPAKLRAAVGLARVRALLAAGQRRHPSLYRPGYAVDLVTNLFAFGISAIGETAQQRRQSRLAIWRNADRFRELAIERPERPDAKAFRCTYDGEPLTAGAGMQFRAPGRREVIGVRLNDQLLAPSPVNGFVSWQDHCSTYVLISLPKLVPGTYQVHLSLSEPQMGL